MIWGHSKKTWWVKNDDFGFKEYFDDLKVEDTRVKFRIRTNMVKAESNFKNMKKNSDELWVCDSCARAIDTQSHLMWCPSYKHLRKERT